MHVLVCICSNVEAVPLDHWYDTYVLPYNCLHLMAFVLSTRQCLYATRQEKAPCCYHPSPESGSRGGGGVGYPPPLLLQLSGVPMHPWDSLFQWSWVSFAFRGVMSGGYVRDGAHVLITRRLLLLWERAVAGGGGCSWWVAGGGGGGVADTDAVPRPRHPPPAALRTLRRTCPTGTHPFGAAVPLANG